MSVGGIFAQYETGFCRSALPCGLLASDPLWSPVIGMTGDDIKHQFSCPSGSGVGVADQSVPRK